MYSVCVCFVLSFEFPCFRSGEAFSHVGALMYAFADLTTKKVDGKLASTSKKCVWDAFNKPRQRKLSPKKASELTFKKPKQEKPDKQFTNLIQDEPVLCFNEDSFRQSLEKCVCVFYLNPIV